MELATLRIDAKVHGKLKAHAQRGGYKIGKLAEKVLAEWADGHVFFASDCAVPPHKTTRKAGRGKA